jgi:hypothetical protein
VQTLYQNAFFLLAVGLAGAVVSLRQRQFLKAAGILGIGFVAAMSLAPYIKPIHDTQDAWLLFKYGITFSMCFDLLHRLVGNFLIVWLVIMILAAVLGIGRIFNKLPSAKKDDQSDVSLFCGIALVLGVVGFGVFVKLSGLPTQVWYYMSVLCFTIACCEGVLSGAHYARVGVLAIALIALAFSPSAYPALRWRQSNVDLAAAQVSKEAVAGDYIIVNPWFCGVTFAYYYKGAAKWATLPAINDFRFERYDLIKEKLQTTNAIAPVLEQAETTLRSGHRVWVVGEVPAPPPGSAMPPDPPVAPYGPTGWLDMPYYIAWEKQLGWCLQNHAAKVTLYVTDSNNSVAVNPLENMALTAFSGWNTNATVSIGGK